jgi:serine-type D-Ala-D-Ala carboxypeptidase (penicillin-binding protein 5/6)
MQYLKDEVPLPHITSEMWCVADVESQAMQIHGKLANQRREVASLTKMMTFYTAYQLQKSLFPG